MTFSLCPHTAIPSHVSTEHQHSKTKCQKSKMFHSKPKSHAALTKKHSPNTGMRSSHSFKNNQPSPMANTNSRALNSYLNKSYDRDCQSSLDTFNLAISHSYGKLPRCTTPCSTQFSRTPTCHSPCSVPEPL